VNSESTRPTDEYSLTLARLSDHPQAIIRSSTIDALTFTGHSETWVVKTVRVEGEETLFLQQVNAEGGRRFVLPPAVVAVITRQHDSAITTVRKRTARKAAATRQAAKRST